MTNEMTNTLPFKVKCIDGNICSLTLGKEYVVVESSNGYYTIKNDFGLLQSYYQYKLEIVDLPSKDKQEFSVGDKVVVNKISDDFVSDNDDNVKVGDVATITKVANEGKLNVLLKNHNWEQGWWFSE